MTEFLRAPAEQGLLRTSSSFGDAFVFHAITISVVYSLFIIHQCVLKFTVYKLIGIVGPGQPANELKSFMFRQ